MDSESNLHYNHFRYYDPSIGRYITSDPIGLNGGISTYGYSLQNPLIYLDFNGLEVEVNSWDWGVKGDHNLPPTDRVDKSKPQKPAPEIIKKNMNKAADQGKFDFGMPNRCLPVSACITYSRSLIGACGFNLACQNAAKKYQTYCDDIPSSCTECDKANALLELGFPIINNSQCENDDDKGC